MVRSMLMMIPMSMITITTMIIVRVIMKMTPWLMDKRVFIVTPFDTSKIP